MKSIFRRVRLLPAGLAVAAVLLAVMQGCAPSLRPYERMRLQAPPVGQADSGLRITFMGVSTLLIQDSATSFLTDGFFTRPGLFRYLWGNLRPDGEVIAAALDTLHVYRPDAPRPGARRLSAVIALHSHFDHAMDAPLVARMTGARLIGSHSTANLARSYVPSGVITTVRAGDVVQVGDDFRVRVAECIHGPPDRWPGTTETPFDTVSRVERYRTGNCHALLIRHGARSLLVTGTAGFVPGALEGLRADVVYLSVGSLGKQEPVYRASYWNEVVRATRARRVVLIHWDNLFEPLFEPLTAVPRLKDNLPRTIRQYCALAVRDGVDLRLAREWVAADPFSGLPADGARLPGGCPAS
jgi:L-ascorbate metabolism protein UlaG (beta-lactamase superfamily)